MAASFVHSGQLWHVAEMDGWTESLPPCELCLPHTHQTTHTHMWKLCHSECVAQPLQAYPAPFIYL